jgi:hypothetical protein
MKLTTIAVLALMLGASSAAVAAEEPQRLLKAKGSVLSHDIYERELRYRIHDETDITLNGKTATLQDMERGFVAKIEYTRDGERREAHKVAAFNYPDAPAVVQAPPQTTEQPIALLELLPLFSASPEAQSKAANEAEFVAIPTRTKTFPRASGTFVRQRILNRDAFVVKTKSGWFSNRDTFILDSGASVYRDERIAKLSQLQRADYVEVVYQRTEEKLLALEVEGTSPGMEVIGSR